MKIKEKHHYEFSDGSMAAIDNYYPKSVSVNFPGLMRQLQAALIRCHFPSMDADTKYRAKKTLDWLEQ